MSSPLWLRLPFLIAPLAFALAACLQSFSVPGITASKSSSVPANTPEQVRLKLFDQCVNESPELFRVSDKTKQQCGCYAGAIVKSMKKDELTFFANYGSVPTLNNIKPEEVKKRCGLPNAIDSPARSRGWQPKNE
jgi:hypothetical protein